MSAISRGTRLPRRGQRLAAFVIAFLASTAAVAQVRNLTWGELSLTPPVCLDVQGISLTGWANGFRHSPRAPHWEALLGPAFWDLHHYCWALVHQQRANRAGTPLQTKRHLHEVAINDFYYVINNALERGQTDLVMLPELYYRAGDAYLQIDDPAKATVEFEKARVAKPDYWPAYVGLSTVKERIGRRKEARDLLERALEAMPGEKGLIEALARLGPGGAAPTTPAGSGPASRQSTSPGSAVPARN